MILVPWRAGDPLRERSWEFCRGWLEDGGFRVVTGSSPDGPFCRSAALNDAARKAGEWDVAVVMDADTIVDPEQIRRAIERARETGHLVVAWDQLVNLNAGGTALILDGEERPWWRHARWVNRTGVSSCLAVPRAVWDAVGGFDERFRGWGFEDRAFYLACRRLAGAERIEGEAWHLWHPRPAEKDPTLPDYRAARALAHRYRAARSKAAMRELLAERRRPKIIGADGQEIPYRVVRP